MPIADEDLAAAVAADVGGRAPVSGALVLSDREAARLRTAIANGRGVEDAALRQRISGLNPARRNALAAEVVEGLRGEVAGRRETTVRELADEFEGRMRDRLPALAEAARAAEEAEVAHVATLDARAARRFRRRPGFPLILKYVLRRIVFAQITEPKTTERRLGADYATPLGVANNDPLFPGIYEEALVTRLRALPSTVRPELQREVADRALSLIAAYLDEQMGGITPDDVRSEYARLSSRLRGQIEGGVEGYLAARMGLLNAFGSPANVQATLTTINAYFDSLVTADFLQGNPERRPRGAGTLVHPELKRALEAAEQMIVAQGWEAAVVASVSSYWSTSVRENRNNPAKLSDHSFGMAIDVDASENPNLASFPAADWQFVNTMVGENVFRDAAGNPTAAVTTLRTGTDTAALLDAARSIAARSERFVEVFDSEDALRARLGEILHGRDVPVTGDALTALLDDARAAVLGPRAERAARERRLRETVRREHWAVHALAGLAPAATPLAVRLVGLLSSGLRTTARMDAAEPLILAQIRNPAATATAAARAAGLGPLFQRAVVRELEALSPGDRSAVADEVIRELRRSGAQAESDARAGEVAALVLRSFSVLQSTRKADGSKVGGGASLANIAAHGFANLNPLFVTAMVSPQGGNLTWLGVHNQDMHHFELKTSPPLPQAAPVEAE